MSRLAKKPITIPAGTDIKLGDGQVTIKGKEGSLALSMLDFVTVDLQNGQLILKSAQTHKQARANLGTMTALIKNAISGVNNLFSKILEIEGIGYRATMEGTNLVVNVGFTHPVKYEPPQGVKVSVEKNTIKVTGVDRALVGQAAAEIRKIKKPEPYKGKGIHYRGEVIRRKAGKRVAGTGAGAAAA